MPFRAYFTHIHIIQQNLSHVRQKGSSYGFAAAEEDASTGEDAVEGEEEDAAAADDDVDDDIDDDDDEADVDDDDDEATVEDDADGEKSDTTLSTDVSGARGRPRYYTRG